MEQIKSFILGLNLQYVSIASTVFLFLNTILITIFLNRIFKDEQIRSSYKSLVDNSRQMVVNGMKVTNWKLFNYDEIDLYIRRSGLAFMTNNKMTPFTYIVARIGFALFFGIIGFQYGVLPGIILIPIGFYAMDFIANQSDASDNTKMLDDIKNVYDTLRIQTKAGVYITSVLTDCYLVVQNKRLKKALLELTSEIAAKNDTDMALDNFRNKFNNSYLDTMVIIIKQSMKTGQAAKMFDDIKIQITDIESAMLAAEQVRIKAQITVVQVLLYMAIIGVSIFIAVVGLQQGLAF